MRILITFPVHFNPFLVILIAQATGRTLPHFQSHSIQANKIPHFTLLKNALKKRLGEKLSSPSLHMIEENHNDEI